MRAHWSLLLFAVGLLTALPVHHADARDRVSLQTYALPHRTTSGQVREDLEHTLLHLVNGERSGRGLPSLAPNAGLQRAARSHGREMFAHGYLSHQSIDGLTPPERISREGIRARLVGENVAYALDIHAAHRALMASPGHRKNILSRQYTVIGIGVLEGSIYGVVVVQTFADAAALSLRTASQSRSPGR